ncbi:hypothetical protein GIB67_030005 [Kingdonia uniflora]|uniref:Uncharacterized protein n=1 Tax=Kingdonia uniflora TaxID=39325 RepID=A0A7J7MY23_9MAGN|nr:hypothetical protein GIB67_030005 [Kingdonia uniflora]
MVKTRSQRARHAVEGRLTIKVAEVEGLNTKERLIEVHRHFWYERLLWTRDMIVDLEARKIIVREIALDEIADEDEMHARTLISRPPSVLSSSFDMDPTISGRSTNEENVGIEDATSIEVEHTSTRTNDTVVLSDDGEELSVKGGSDDDDYVDFPSILHSYPEDPGTLREF